MRCKTHPSDEGSKGVCAFCLSERLSALKPASEDADDRQRSYKIPPSSFPATGSSDPPKTTPQASTADKQPKAKNGTKRGRLSFFFSLFRRSRSKGRNRHPTSAVSKSRIAPSSSPWASAFRKKKRSRLASVDDEIPATVNRKASRTTVDRGLSPRTSTPSSPAAGVPRSPEESKKKPAAGPPTKKASKRRRGRHLSKLAVCLNPMVRARPRRNHRQERFFACKFRGCNRQSRSSAPSLCPNRSRKIADFGRQPQ